MRRLTSKEIGKAILKMFFWQLLLVILIPVSIETVFLDVMDGFVIYYSIVDKEILSLFTWANWPLLSFLFTIPTVLGWWFLWRLKKWVLP